MNGTMRPFATCCFLMVAVAACSAGTTSTTDPTHTTSAQNAATVGQRTTKDHPMDVYSLSTSALDGTPVDLAIYRGKVTLVANVASECGYTPQYTGLQKLHAELKDRGFAVLGFPSNDFGAQEPGTPDQIRDFCTTKYQVGFPLFAKVQTKTGPGQSPVYALLGAAAGKLPNWNFCKYLVGKDGTVLSFHPSKQAPDDPALRAAIEAALE